MSEVFVEDYIRKIILLEKQVGTKTSYQMLEPFPLNSRDIIVIQNAAKKIAEFVGLHGFTFIIATVKQKEKVGAHVELKYNEKEVFVEISDDVLKFEDAVLATLAHEITHKYLHVNGISCGMGPIHEYENEVLTDITTVFLGLGKLMLNGCECQNARREYVPEGTRTITETLKSGYLDRRQLAIVYRLVCAMRKIPSPEYEQGLSTDSIQALRECERHYRYYFDNRFHEPDIRNELVEYLHSAIRETQSILSNIDKNLLYLQHACVDVVETFLEKTHKWLMELLLESQKMMNGNAYDPCMKFLNAIQIDQRIAKLVSELNGHSSEAKRYLNYVTKLAKFAQTFGNPFSRPSSDMFTVVTCWNDGTKLRLPEDKSNLIVKCPKCQYQFVADTSVPESKMKKLLKRLFGRK